VVKCGKENPECVYGVPFPDVDSWSKEIKFINGQK
jgi:hypothetical protein